MCRNIKLLFNLDPPTNDDEVHDAALQFVRKVSGMRKPSQANTAAFEQAVDDVAEIVGRLLDELETRAEPKDREEIARKKRERFRRRQARA